MNTTSADLTVLADFQAPEGNVTVHPNDGFDLGVMMTETPIILYANISVEDFQAGSGSPIQGKLLQENKCRLHTIELGKKYWQKIGSPKKVKLHFEDQKLLIEALDHEKT